MFVHVRGFLTFRELIGDRVFDYSSDRVVTLLSLLEEIAQDIGVPYTTQVFDSTSGKLQPDVIILVNGRHYKNLPEELHTLLEEGDEIAIFPPMIGGS